MLAIRNLIFFAVLATASPVPETGAHATTTEIATTAPEASGITDATAILNSTDFSTLEIPEIKEFSKSTKSNKNNTPPKNQKGKNDNSPYYYWAACPSTRNNCPYLTSGCPYSVGCSSIYWRYQGTSSAAPRLAAPVAGVVAVAIAAGVMMAA
jgi:hypothetical protein